MYTQYFVHESPGDVAEDDDAERATGYLHLTQLMRGPLHWKDMRTRVMVEG